MPALSSSQHRSTDYSIHPQMVRTYCVPGLERPSGDGDQPSSPSILPTDFPLTHSLQPPCCCLNTPGTLPPQGLCTGSALCLDHSSPNIQVAPPPPLQGLGSNATLSGSHSWTPICYCITTSSSLSGPCFVVVFWLRCMVCGMSLSQAGTEHGPWQWKHGLLITRPPGNSVLLFIIIVL